MAKKFSTKKQLENVGQVSQLRNKLLANLSTTQLYARTKEELCYYVLIQFDFKDIEIKKDDIQSLNTAARLLVRLMGISDDFEEKSLFSDKNKFADQLDRLLYYFLEFREIPGIEKYKLETAVNEDLVKINKFIGKYSGLDFIKNGEKPRNHHERTVYEFHQRGVEEKVKIEEYLLNGINERALYNAGKHQFSWGLEGLFDGFGDRPYRLPVPKSEEYFDFESIDKIGHRIGEIELNKGRELKSLYKQDKAEFYKELWQIIPVEKELKLMHDQVHFLPYLSDQRKLIFDEIVELYNSAKWFGFYALALTQIEGLFTEMCRLCKPGFNNPKASLPDKVDIVRPYFAYSASKFDYFQYHLPNLRNRFLHFGIDSTEEIQILSNDILYDLQEVVSIFVNLSIDANWLLLLIRKKALSDFSDINSLMFYVRMLNSVKKSKQFDYFEDEISALNKDFFPDVLKGIVGVLEDHVEALISEVVPSVEANSKKSGFAIDIAIITNKSLADNKPSIKAALSNTVAHDLKNQFEELLKVQLFFKCYDQHFDLAYIDDVTKNTIVNLSNKYNTILGKIKLITLACDFKVKN